MRTKFKLIAGSLLFTAIYLSASAQGTAFIFRDSFIGDGSKLVNVPVSAITGGLTTNVVIGAQTLYFTNGILIKIQ